MDDRTTTLERRVARLEFKINRLLGLVVNAGTLMAAFFVYTHTVGRLGDWGAFALATVAGVLIWKFLRRYEFEGASR
jgi:hypothetical protein